MANNRLLSPQAIKTLKQGATKEHPLFVVGLGICSSLAVSNTVNNALAMGFGVTFVLIATAVIIAGLRKLIPPRARMITYMVTISAFVIIVQKFLDAFSPPSASRWELRRPDHHQRILMTMKPSISPIRLLFGTDAIGNA